jgi:hypothetical protein
MWGKSTTIMEVLNSAGPETGLRPGFAGRNPARSGGCLVSAVRTVHLAVRGRCAERGRLHWASLVPRVSVIASQNAAAASGNSTKMASATASA